jgi:hypothetical protein
VATSINGFKKSRNNLDNHDCRANLEKGRKELKAMQNLLHSVTENADYVLTANICKLQLTASYLFLGRFHL